MHWTRKTYSILINSLIFVTHLILDIQNAQAVVILKIRYTLGSFSETQSSVNSTKYYYEQAVVSQ